MTTYLKNRARAKLVVPTLILALTGAAQAQFQYTTNDSTITITRYSGSGIVTIPEQIGGLPVTGVAPLAFYPEWPPITSIRIPATLTNIAPGGSESPFVYCFGLTEFDVDERNPAYSSAEGILFDRSGSTLLFYPPGKAGAYAIPGAVTAIARGAFYKCPELTGLTIHNNVTNIGDFAFCHCSALSSLTIGTGLTSLRPGVFQGCHSLSRLTFPESITSIGEAAFADCSALNIVTIGNGVIDIQGSAFSRCYALTNVTISSAVTNVAATAFSECPLISINVHTNNNAYRSVAGVLFDKSQSTLVLCPRAKVGTYLVPNGVTRIGWGAFQSCWGLTNITLPQTLVDIGDYAFYGCGLATLTIPNSVTNIGESAFQYCGLRSLTIPDSVTTIGRGAFTACVGLTKVIMGAGVTRIGPFAFVNCYSLKTLFFRGNAPALADSIFVHTTGGRIDVTLYYLPGTTGWESNLAGRVPVLWDPKIERFDRSFGVGTNGFGFTISGSGNFSVIVEACTNLASPVWFVVGGKRLTSEPWYFSDSEWTNSTSRFYRIPEP